MKRTMIWGIIAIFVLSACAASSGAEQGGTTNSTMLANSTASTTISTVPTTSTKPTTSSTVSTTMPTTVSSVPTTSTTQAPNSVLYESGFITVYEKNGNYIFQLIDGGKVEFSPDRKVVRTISIDPIKCDNYRDLTNRSFDEIISMIGKPHYVLGSGISIPFYITEDAYILCLYPNYDGIVESIIVMDPIEQDYVVNGFFSTLRYEKYQEFVAQNDLSDNFIPYESFSFFGPFEYIYVHEDPNEENWHFYWYSMETCDDFSIQVSFDSLLEEDIRADYKELECTLKGDLRTLDTKENSFVRLNNARYIYDSLGKLTSIIIECDRFNVSISVADYMGKGFALVNDTHPEMIRNLLHADTAAAAIQAFMDCIAVEAR